MDDDSSVFDLSQLNFDEFVSFFFNHDMDTDEHWWHDSELIGFNDFNEKGVESPRVIVEHMTRLFTNFAEVASKFSLQQINVGIWAMLSGGGPFVLQKRLWLPSTPLRERQECVRSMYLVYAHYVAKSKVDVMENCFLMWWDLVAGGFWQQLYFDEKITDGNVAALNQEQRAVLDTMFETLSRMLLLPDARTQHCALHGLGHLHHPGTRDLVQRYLDENRDQLTPDGLRWIEKCRDGTVM